jgi:putative membrane protein
MHPKVVNILCIGTLIAVSIWAAINPINRFNWFLENTAVLAFLLFWLLKPKTWTFSPLSKVLITVFLTSHIIAAHYSYSVPFGETLGDMMGTDRNMYDRLVHFLFGVCMVFPVAEICARYSRSRTFCAITAIMIIVAFGAAYEVFEWSCAVILDPEKSSVFLGLQGDEWDAQKDILVAIIGSFAIIPQLFVRRVPSRLGMRTVVTRI